MKLGRNAALRLSALRSALFMLLTFGHDGGTKLSAQIFGQFVELRVAVDLDGLFGGVANHVTVMAPGKMILQFDFGVFVDHTVQIIGELV